MRVSKLIHAMHRDDEIVIDDFSLPIDIMTVYSGAVRGIKKDNHVNKFYVMSIHALDDKIYVLASRERSNR